MEIEEFWQIVNTVAWGTPEGAHHLAGPYTGKMDVLGIQRTLRGAYTELQLEECALFASYLVRGLRDRVFAWEKTAGQRIGLPHEALDDLLSHVIGLGEVEYEACLQSPQRLLDRADAEEYEENFRYCFERPV
jgi:hypothetical protein